MIDLGHGEGKVSLTAELCHHQSAEQLMGLPASSASERRYTLEVLTEALAWAPAGTSERLSIGLVAMFTEAKAVADFVGRWRPGSAPAKITRTGQRAPAREVAMGHRVYMGVPTVVESAAEETPFAALFEDDGKVGYFYGMDRRLGERAVLDSVYVYNVGWVLDHPAPDLDVHEPCEVEIVWSSDQQRAALLINGRPHAAFDFGAKRAYCRENFPAGSSWSAAGHAWDDQAVDFLAVVREQRQRPGAA